MSYIQVEIGGKLRGLKFNNFGLEQMYKALEGNSVIAFSYALIWGGLEGNRYVKREEADYSFENVCDWVDALPAKTQTIESVTKVMTETQNYKDLIKAGEEVVKKKVRKKPVLKT